MRPITTAGTTAAAIALVIVAAAAIALVVAAVATAAATVVVVVVVVVVVTRVETGCYGGSEYYLKGPWISCTIPMIPNGNFQMSSVMAAPLSASSMIPAMWRSLTHTLHKGSGHPQPDEGGDANVGRGSVGPAPEEHTPLLVIASQYKSLLQLPT